MKKIFGVIAIIVLPGWLGSNAGAQGMSVNTTGASANSSAMLDVSSTSKGVLIPRMTSTQRTTGISSPAQGLMVYQTDPPQGFYYYDGSAWNYIGNGTGTVTSVSSSNLTPIFTSSVTASTTTPSISYSLSNSSAYTVLTNSTNATSTPTYGKVVAQALNASNSPSSTTFYRGDGQWSVPVNSGTVRTVTSSTTLTASDWIVIDNSPSCCGVFTLFSAGLVPKGYELTLLHTGNPGSYVTFIKLPSGVSYTFPAGGAMTGSGSGTLAGGFNYSAVLVSDGVSMWYWKAGQ